MADICSQRGLLGQLAALNFPALAGLNQRHIPLTKRGAYLEDVYATGANLPVWRVN